MTLTELRAKVRTKVESAVDRDEVRDAMEWMQLLEMLGGYIDPQ